MRDIPQSTLLLPTRDTSTLGSTTPSGLTPNTRSEAEAALTHNTIAQTDSAAPPIPLTEAQKAYRRTPNPIQTSTNYEAALLAAHAEASASSNLSSTSLTSPTDTDADKSTSFISAPTPADFPLPGQGVVPRHHASVGSGQAEMVRKAKPSGLSLGDLGRQQSWNGQDLRHVMQGALMSPEDTRSGDAGYGSRE